jgi:hypothetical protein
VLKLPFLPEIRPTKFNYPIAVYGKSATIPLSSPAIGPRTAFVRAGIRGPFAHREYVSRDTFDLSYRRYTGEWLCIFQSQAMALFLTDETCSIPAVVVRSRTAPTHPVERSAIIPHLADRRGASESAAALGTDRPRVTRCARRVAPSGSLEAISDLPRSGSLPDITEASHPVSGAAGRGPASGLGGNKTCRPLDRARRQGSTPPSAL